MSEENTAGTAIYLSSEGGKITYERDGIIHITNWDWSKTGFPGFNITQDGKVNLTGEPKEPPRPPEKLSKHEKWEAYQEWTKRDRDSSYTFEEWSENKFGAHTDGNLKVSRSTLNGWKRYRKLFENS